MDECLVHSIFQEHAIPGRVPFGRAKAPPPSPVPPPNDAPIESFHLVMLDKATCTVNKRPKVDWFLEEVIGNNPRVHFTKKLDTCCDGVVVSCPFEFVEKKNTHTHTSPFFSSASFLYSLSSVHSSSGGCSVDSDSFCLSSLFFSLCLLFLSLSCQCCARFDVWVMTAGTRDYAQPLLDVLDPNVGPFCGLLFSLLCFVRFKL